MFMGIFIGMVIFNSDVWLKDYSYIVDKFWLSYVDYIFYVKYGYCDYWGGGCFFVCEMVVWVVVGVIVKFFLKS